MDGRYSRRNAPTANFSPWNSEALDALTSGGKKRRAMHDVIHAPDDGVAEVRLAPGEEASVSFRPDPEAADAGADLADDLGRSFLQGAVEGEDEGELAQVPEGEASERGELADLANEEAQPTLEADGEELTARPRVRPRRSRRS